jgi:O-antigen/teichoic acid export membrane protein
MSLALASTDRFVLAAFMGTAEVGAYHAGYSLSNRSLDIIFMWLGMAGSPATVAALERGGQAALERTAGAQAAIMLLITVPASVGLALVSLPLCQLMVGPELAAQAARVTPWIAYSALFAGLSTHYLHTAFTLSRKPGRQLVAIAAPALANLALTLLLIPRFGLDGAVWATTASYGIGMVVSYVLMRGAIHLPIPWGTLARVAIASALMALVVVKLPALGGLPELLLKAGVGGLVYALAALTLDAGGARTEGVKLLRGLKGVPA